MCLWTAYTLTQSLTAVNHIHHKTARVAHAFDQFIVLSRFRLASAHTLKQLTNNNNHFGSLTFLNVLVHIRKKKTEIYLCLSTEWLSFIIYLSTNGKFLYKKKTKNGFVKYKFKSHYSQYFCFCFWVLNGKYNFAPNI